MSERRRPEVVLFDAGNTLVFLDHDALAVAGEKVGYPVAGSVLRASEPLAKKRYEAALTGGVSHADGWYLYIETLFVAAGMQTSLAGRAARAARELHDDFNLWRRVPADLVSALEDGRRSGLRYGVVSNSEGKLAELLARVALLDFFEVVVDSALVGVSKPDPAIFRHALDAMDARPEATMYAGDIPHIDVDGARAAGIDGVLIDTLGHYANYVGAPRFASVAALIESLGA